MRAVQRIAVDCDEVLYSWERTARYLLRKVWKGGVNGYDLSQPFSKWLVAEQVGVPAYEWLFSPEGGIKSGLFRHGHVITNAMLGIRALKSEGYDLLLVTHRPEDAVQDTIAWIDFHFGKEDPYPWSGVSILSGGEPKTSVEWDLIIDDSPKTCEAALMAGRKAIAFKAAWNSAWGTWENVPETVKALAYGG
jgi:5'(3')-deoxyribonucleotidase